MKKALALLIFFLQLKPVVLEEGKNYYYMIILLILGLINLCMYV